MLAVVGGEGTKMEQNFDSKLRIQDESSNNGFRSGDGDGANPVQRGKSFQFRAPQENFTVEDFELGKIYGVGSYSKVVRARKKDTGVIYALKIMDKKFITKENKTSYVKLERIVLDQLDHPGIVPAVLPLSRIPFLYTWPSNHVKVGSFLTR
ncbi:3-phosphoinositide-dependent protein kinase 1 [Bienertia sinuspersici]